MKIKFLFCLLCISVTLSTSYAKPNLSNLLLQRAYEQVNIRIEKKTDSAFLDENTKKTIEQKKDKIGSILESLEDAYEAKDKVKFKEQARLFRSSYKELLSYVTSIANSRVSVNTHKNIPRLPESVDVTYYADRFEGGNTANGNIFSQSSFSAAACEIPFNTLVQVRKDNASVVVKLNDRPNCVKHPKLVDLSRTAFGTVSKISNGRFTWTVSILGTVSKGYIKKLIPTSVFKDLWIELDDGIPNTYLKNETIHISGKELNWKEYAIFYLKTPSGKDITLGTKKWSDGRFEYSYPLDEVGLYRIIIASWLGFKTTTFFDITVLDDEIFTGKTLTSSKKNPNPLHKLEVERVEFPDFTAVYLFRLPAGYFHTLTIKSGQTTYTYRGFWHIAIRWATFMSLDLSKPVSVEITAEESLTPFSHDTYTVPESIFKQDMLLTPGYREERNENISISEEGGNLVVRGIIANGKNVKTDIIITLPNGNVKKYPFDSISIDADGFLKRGQIFEKMVPLDQDGTYLVEVNYDNGFAAYNWPISYGKTLPVYPNEYDSVVKLLKETDTATVKKESLIFVNALRKKSGQPALLLDDNLSKLATIKANDMAKYNNLSHTDSNGDKINGTAKRSGVVIAGWIGENIAGGNISFRALLIGLAYSGGHRANMLDKWKHMGIWYVVKDGQVYYVQIFGE